MSHAAPEMSTTNQQPPALALAPCSALLRENELLRAWVADAANRLDDAADDNPDHWASDESRRNTIKEWATNLREALATLSPNVKGEPRSPKTNQL